MSDEKTELLPCPFCGGEAEICHVTQLWEPRDAYWVKCKNCRISGKHHTTESEAIDAWNTRADTEYGGITATDENMAKHGWVRERTCENINGTCSSCGAVMYDAPNYCPNCGRKVVSE